jgi:hypothetical protein
MMFSFKKEYGYGLGNRQEAMGYTYNRAVGAVRLCADQRPQACYHA